MLALPKMTRENLDQASQVYQAYYRKIHIISLKGLVESQKGTVRVRCSGSLGPGLGDVKAGLGA